MGHKQKSALLPKPDIGVSNRRVCFGPVAEIGSIAIVQEAMLRHTTNYMDFGKLAWPRFDLD